MAAPLAPAKSCCPAGSWPAVKPAASYKQQGQVVTIGELECYVVGQPGAMGTGIIVMYDVFGFKEGSHIRGVCDELAEAGHYVVMPDFYRGGSIEPYYQAGKASEGKQWLKQFNWAYITKHLEPVHQHLTDKGVHKVGSIGFCWGAWAVAKACQDPSKVRAGVWCHPSCQVARELYEGETEQELAGALRAPTLILAASNDTEHYRNGELTKIMAENGVASDAVLFPDMVHGWVTRGAGVLGKGWAEASTAPESDSKVQTDVRRALQLAIGWFAKHLFE